MNPLSQLNTYLWQIINIVNQKSEHFSLAAHHAISFISAGQWIAVYATEKTQQERIDRHNQRAV